MGVSAVDLASRSVLAVSLDDIKAEFGVGDTALGVLGGAYFGLAVLSGIPFGILADRMSRARIIAIGFIPWSVGMLLQSVAAAFAVLVFARVLLGSIEASNGPTSQSLLGDYYPVRRRSRVFGIWRLGEVIGSSVGFAVAGVIATAFGWRWSFATFGFLGVLCGLLVLRFLPEPPRGVADALYQAEERAAGEVTSPSVDEADKSVPDLSFRAAFRRLVRIRTAWVMVLAAGLSDFFFVGLGAWATSFFRREHGVEASVAGAVMSVVLLTVIAGAVVGGRYSDRLLAEGRVRRPASGSPRSATSAAGRPPRRRSPSRASPLRWRSSASPVSSSTCRSRRCGRCGWTSSRRRCVAAPGRCRASCVPGSPPPDPP